MPVSFRQWDWIFIRSSRLVSESGRLWMTAVKTPLPSGPATIYLLRPHFLNPEIRSYPLATHPAPSRREAVTIPIPRPVAGGAVTQPDICHRHFGHIVCNIFTGPIPSCIQNQLWRFCCRSSQLKSQSARENLPVLPLSPIRSTI